MDGQRWLTHAANKQGCQWHGNCQEMNAENTQKPTSIVGLPMIIPLRLLVAFAFLVMPVVARADDDFERAPINYSKAKPNNSIERLQEKIDAGKLHLPFHAERGYLSAVLNALQVPQSSQVLVFSKTSLQRQRISPWSPRAL